MRLRRYDPDMDEPRSFKIDGLRHPRSLPLLLDAMGQAMQRAGPSQASSLMDAVTLQFGEISEGTVRVQLCAGRLPLASVPHLFGVKIQLV